MAGFNELATAAKKEGALDLKHKELIAIAIAVSLKCTGCIGFHVQSFVKLNGTREELSEALAMAVYMGGGPSIVHSAEALSAFDEFIQQTDEHKKIS